MKCDKCGKDLTEADIPEYLSLAILEAEPNRFFACKPCRDLIEKAKDDVKVLIALKQIDELIAKGSTVWVKFTCHNCCSRQTSEEPNKFFGRGYSCEECGKITFPDKIGYSVMFRT
jgi:hypothetical protein